MRRRLPLECRAPPKARALDENSKLKLNKASDLMGSDVNNTANEEIGEIKELVIDPEAARVNYFVMSSGGWGHNYYENDYVKEDGVWKMKKLHGPFNMYSGYKLGWLDDVVVNTFPEKFKPWPDLPPTVIYLTYPNYYVEPFHYPNPVTGKLMPPPDPRAGGESFGRK